MTSRFPSRLRSRRRLLAAGVAVGLVVLALIPVLIAQARRPAALPPGLQSANKALLEGRFDEVPGLVAQLDPQDPRVVAIKARALIARGHYAEAESLLRPAAQRA